MTLDVSILWDKSSEEDILSLARQLLLSDSVHRIFLVGNSTESTPDAERFAAAGYRAKQRIQHIPSDRHLSRGAAHNSAIRESIYDEVPFHLIISPHIQLTAEALNNLLVVMQANKLIGQLTPRIIDTNGELQYLCKALPTPPDLLRQLFTSGKDGKGNHRFELRHLDHSRPINAPYLSGCFLLLRTEALLTDGLFDEHFALWLDDLDLSRRIHRDFLTLYYPAETLVYTQHSALHHNHQLHWQYIADIFRYFNKWGWLFDHERHQFNKPFLKY